MAAVLPPLREELALFPGPAAGDGSPTWSLQDPVRNLFFSIDWLGFEVLSRWHLGEPQAIVDAIGVETPIMPEAGDVERVLGFLEQNELVRRHDAAGTAFFSDEARRRKRGLFTWLLHNYLFFRMPLFRPDTILARALPLVAPLYSRAFLLMTLAALVFGLIGVSRQWEVFSASLLDSFSWQGAASLFLALVFSKAMHELGHAFTARRFGCRVPTMGVAFLVLFPMAYTDVNETWKLPDRNRRLAVGAAGMLTELAIAIWATAGWCVLPDGLLRGAFFMLATTTWVSTLAINASPFMRFDGYFLLMDWLGMPNLHQRAFDLARWQLREWLFAPGETPPEALAGNRRRGVIAFAWVVWLYRLVVFGGIAMLVYRVVPKPLGPLLAGIELWWFILRPVLAELGSWGGRGMGMLASRRSVATLLSCLLAVVVLVIPWDTRVSAQGMLRPAGVFRMVSPGPALVRDLPVAAGATVEAGAVAVRLEAPDLDFQLRGASARASSLQWQVDAGGVDEALRRRGQVLHEEVGKARAEVAGIVQQQRRHELHAPFAGRVVPAHPDLAPGVWVARNEPLGVLLDAGTWTVEMFLPEAGVQRIAVGDAGRFYSESAGLALMNVRVVRIDADATRLLEEKMLSSTRGGALLARERNRQIVPEAAVYRVMLEVEGGARRTPDLRELRGQVVVHGRATSLAGDFLRTALALAVREAGF